MSPSLNCGAGIGFGDASGFAAGGAGIFGAPPVSGTICRSSSANAFSICSLLSGLPCQFGRPSVNDTPFPFSVRARMTVGRPLVARASL